MGLAFLPWERLPAYVLGPLLCALSIGLMIAGEAPSFWYWAMLVGLALFGAWIVWARYKTGEEPLWTEDQRAKARQRRAEQEESERGQ